MSAGLKLLTRLLQERRSFDFSKLNPEYLAPDERTVYDEISNYLRAYGVLPDIQNITQLQNVELLESDVYQKLVDDVTDRYVVTQFIEHTDRLNEAVREGHGRTLLDTLKEFTSAQVFSTQQGRELYTMQEAASQALEQIIEGMYSGGVVGIPSGWPSLDRATSGFKPGNVYVFVARPKMGKTMSILKVMEHSRQNGYVPLLLSMEMSRSEIAKRHLAMMTGIPMSHITQSRIGTMYGIPRIQEAISAMDNLPPAYIVEGQFRKDTTSINALVQGLQPHILLVDGGYLVKLAKRYAPRQKWEYLGEVIEDLKLLSQQQNIPVVVSFQFNREAKKSKPTTGGIENIQLSDAIGWIASAVVGIFEDSNRQDRRILNIAASREGGEGTKFYVNWDFTRMNFDEIEDEFNQQFRTLFRHDTEPDYDESEILEEE